MKNSSKRIFTLLILFVSVLIFSMLAVSAASASTQQSSIITDDVIEIEAKYKKTSINKITFNANGGKIGSKKTVATNIKKGAKINKFPTTPKRTGYKFKGWYTKKIGGKKVTVSTKPTKNIILYAQWTKKPSSRVLNAEEKKLVGVWDSLGIGFKTMKWAFKEDGSFWYVTDLRFSFNKWAGAKGFYSLKNGVLTTNAQYGEDYDYDYYGNLDLKGWRNWSPFETDTNKLNFGTDERGQYVDIGKWGKFYKQ